AAFLTLGQRSHRPLRISRRRIARRHRIARRRSLSVRLPIATWRRGLSIWRRVPTRWRRLSIATRWSGLPVATWGRISTILTVGVIGWGILLRPGASGRILRRGWWIRVIGVVWIVLRRLL